MYRRLPLHRDGALRRQTPCGQRHRSGDARPAGPQHASAAPGREQHPARSLEQGRRRHRALAQPSRRASTHLTEHRQKILVEDNGVGIPEAILATLFEQGIGVSNVNERLKVLFGENYKMWIDSRPGDGTSTGIEIPEQVSGTVVGVESLVGSG
ncbi:MAG: hypothetical protein DMG59_13770 [Acidobacteria bacterium]|nr:MAG: hypothetical protein DMG59_13770 [Acidobacteriota bacterium]